MRRAALLAAVPLWLAWTQAPADRAGAPSIVGSWRQAEWKLCPPADRAEAVDLDAPIDDLTFRADGTFSVTWKGGGARTTSVPSVTLPDYSGTFTVTLATGAIQLRYPSGVTPPRDF